MGFLIIILTTLLVLSMTRLISFYNKNTIMYFLSFSDYIVHNSYYYIENNAHFGIICNEYLKQY